MIFDWDGVVVDSSALHELSWEELAKERSLPFPPGSFKKTFGQVNSHIIPNILKWVSDPDEVDELSRRKEFIYRALCTKNGLPMIRGVREFLQDLKTFHIPCAIGSSTPLVNLKFALDSLDLWEYFAAIVSAGDVENGKPAPDVFLKAAERLGMEPESCAVFEDSVHGIEAAKAAGMKIAAVASTHERPFLEEKNVDMIVDDFAGLDALGVSALWK